MLTNTCRRACGTVQDLLPSPILSFGTRRSLGAWNRAITSQGPYESVCGLLYSGVVPLL
jgi:hypothetical protein